MSNLSTSDNLQNRLTEIESRLAQRDAELAIINSVQHGLASKLEFQAIIDLIGDQVAQIFNSQVTSISLYNAALHEIHHLYILERGERLYFDKPVPIDKFRQHVVETRQPWLINHNYIQIAVDLDEGTVLEGEEPKSLVFVPMIVGNDVTGIISLQNLDVENAFSDSDLRLLSTIANSMSVALENARLFDETQRLFKAEQQRAAELETINALSQTLASQLELQTLIELVGEKIRETFDVQSIYVALYDKSANIITFPYDFDNNVRMTGATIKFGQGMTSQIINSHQPLLINRNNLERHQELGIEVVGTLAKSYLGVPIMAREEAIGVISVQSVDHEDHFTDSDVRLLSTIAANVGVAIENARLYQEIQHRAQEMATLAEIGSDIAASRDLLPVLTRIAAHAKDLLHVRDIAIYLREPDSVTFRAPVALGAYTEEIINNPVQMGQGISGSIAQSGVAELINDPMRDPRVFHIPGQRRRRRRTRGVDVCATDFTRSNDWVDDGVAATCQRAVHSDRT